MPNNRTAPALVQPAPLATEAPEFLMDGVGGTGFENVDSSDIVIPRISLLQPVAPMSSEDGYSSGDFVDMTSRHNFGKSFLFVPIFYYANRIKWEDPSDIGSGIDCRSFDAKEGTTYGACSTCTFSQWIDKAPPECTLFKNVLMLPLERDTTTDTVLEAMQSSTPSVFAAKRTATKPMTEFISAAMMLRVNGRPAPLYSSYYEIKAARTEGPRGVYFVPKMTRQGFLPTREAFEYATEMNKQAHAAQARISATTAEAEVIENGVATPSTPGYDF